MRLVTVRLRSVTRDRIAELAEQDGRSVSAIVDDAIRDYERKRFFERLNEAVARTRADPVAWAEYQAEVAVFENAIADGLTDLDDTDYSTW